jgi:short-subunit dehydrogenase
MANASVWLSDPMKLDGARALVTGASGGIGAAIASELADHGARVVLSSRSPERLRTVLASLPRDGHEIIPADLSSPGGAEELVAAAGEVDVFVSSAGLPASGWLEEYEGDQVARALHVNLEAPMQITRLLLPKLVERGRGHLLFVSSLAGKVPSPGLSIYCATKFGLRGFALALATELSGTRVGVSVICPGFVRDTGMFADSGAELPPAVGSSSADDVAREVRQAIVHGRQEVVVAPRRHRAISHAALMAPRLWRPALSGKAAVETAKQIAAGQAQKR